MAVSLAPRGMIVDLITPFKDDGAIDGQILKTTLERIIPYSQAVLLASPKTGEGVHLSSVQRLGLLEEALAVVGGRHPVMIWVSQATEEETIETILVLEDALEREKYGGEVFFVDTPLLYHSNRGLPDLYGNICSMVDTPFILCNDPEMIKNLERPLKRRNIRTSILKELTYLERIAGVIFYDSLERSHHYQKACRKRSHFRIYDGDEMRFLEHPSMSGIVSIGANLAPKAWQEITKFSLEVSVGQNEYPDRIQQILDLGHYLHELEEIYHRAPVKIIKGILFDMGIIRSPTCISPAEDVEKAKRQIKELMVRNGDWPERDALSV